VIDDNLRETAADPTGTLDPGVCRAIHRASRIALEAHGCLVEARRMHGLVRQCHGDLHLHNVFLERGEPVLFDAIEFNDTLACVDVMYDFAFLLMDLVYRGLPAQANAALNSYLEERHDYRGLALLPLFLSCRADVRAKVGVAAAAVQADPEAASRLRIDAKAYLALAERLLRPAPPVLVGIGGLSGSGKSTLAAALAPAVGAVPGAIVLRTDVIRKRMFGVDPLHRLPGHAYEPAVTERVYARALHAAEACLRSGHAAIVDAVFADERHRVAVERLAREAGTPFRGVWLDVPCDVAIDRLATREADASDATADVLRTQMRRDPGRIGWARLDGRRVLRDAPVTLEEIASRSAGVPA
jgi:predicted kinase